jgi:hypothetical protein
LESKKRLLEYVDQKPAIFVAAFRLSAFAKRFFTYFSSGCSLQGLNNESRIKSGIIVTIATEEIFMAIVVLARVKTIVGWFSLILASNETCCT